ncbi:MAG: hypothetical protein OEW00_03475 [candidate division Zixibacteria bacterium]|nr:hypothetical protein [candidate division Zixibacteria bacterium]
MQLSSVKTVTIAFDGTACTVSPPELMVKKSDEVFFDNQTPAEISVLCSEDKIFGLPGQFAVGAEGKEPHVVGDCPPGWYPYAVYCRCIEGYARAASMPIIIVTRD